MTKASPVRAATKATDLLTLDDVRAAAARIEGAVVRTPMLRSQTLSEITGADIWLKFENHQFTAAYKERGALNALLHLDEEQRARGVIAASAGNHSQGLSYHGRRLGVPVTIVMPETTPSVKVMQTQSVGGDVVLFGETFDEAYAHALELEQERGLTFVHPFDDPLVAAGQGTVALEMLAEKDDFDCLVVPIGGGGLMSGMATVAKALKPEIEMVGVQAELYPSMYSAVTGDDRPCGGDTLAEGIAVKAPGAFTRQIIAELVDEVLLVKESTLEHSVSLLLQIEKTVVEGAGAAGLAARLLEQAQHAEWQRGHGGIFAKAEFERTPAEVGKQALRMFVPVVHTKRGVAGFFFTRQNPGRRAKGPVDEVDHPTGGGYHEVDALVEGRDLFLDRCAAVYGLYPEVAAGGQRCQFPTHLDGQLSGRHERQTGGSTRPGRREDLD